MNKKSKIISLTIVLVIFLTVLACGLPSANTSAATSFDNAHLMMISSRGLLDLYTPIVPEGSGQVLPSIRLITYETSMQLLSTLEEMNQQKALAAEYQRLAEAAERNGHQVLQETFTRKAQACLERAQQLEQKRAAWRRNRRFGNVIRRGARAFGQAIREVLNFAAEIAIERLESRIEFYVNEIRAFLANPIRYGFDLALNRQLEIIKNQFIDRLGPFFGQRAYELLNINQEAWNLEGQIFNKPTKASTKPTEQSPQPTLQSIQPTTQSIQPTKQSVQPTKQSITTTVPTITPTPIIFTGSWHSQTACPDNEEEPYRWGITLTEAQDGSVTGTIYFHGCPGGGEVNYSLSGVHVPGEQTLTLQGIRTGGRYILYASSPTTQEFIIRLNEPPEPNFAP